MLQIKVIALATPPMRLFFHCATTKDYNRSRAMWQTQQQQFTRVHMLVQFLVAKALDIITTSTWLGQVHTQSLPTLTLFQMEWTIPKKSWLALATSLIVRWRCFILFNPSCSLALSPNPGASDTSLSETSWLRGLEPNPMGDVTYDTKYWEWGFKETYLSLYL